MNKPTASACSSDPWSASIAKPPPRAFSRYLVDTAHTADQVDFVDLIVSELTANDVMDASRLCESPFTDHAPGPRAPTWSSPTTTSTRSSTP
jgi:hypothetical protein